MKRTRTALAFAFAAALDASAVTLGADGLGQALIYPYYTVRATDGTNAFNTYISVVNHTADAKALRVRVREGRNAREVASFNLYLSPNDAWAGAMGPTPDGARLVTIDRSCVDPVLASAGGVASLDFRNDAYSGAASDGFGEGLDRTREGYVEIIEMATLTGASATAVTHNSAGVPVNCAAIRTGTPLVGNPAGGLSGTLTLINVNNGMDFTLNAEALAHLSTRPFLRPPSDPYPDLAAAEIDPVSMVVANGMAYRSTWSRPVEAVSAVLMRSHWLAEYVRDAETLSATDFVMTFPTRHFHADRASFTAPFTTAAVWFPTCGRGPGGFTTPGEPAVARFFNREEAFFLVTGEGSPLLSDAPPQFCAASAVISSTEIYGPFSPYDSVLASQTRGAYIGAGGQPRYQNGWMAIERVGRGGMTSLPGSLRTDLATGAVTTGPHAYSGLPVVGFALRTFRNGTLSCAGAGCQGNYGGSFPFKYRRQISP